MRSIPLTKTFILVLFLLDISAGTCFCLTAARTAWPSHRPYADSKKASVRLYDRCSTDRGHIARTEQNSHRNQVQYTSEATSVALDDPQLLDGLTRPQLQSLCKKLKLRAIGKTSDLKQRVSVALRQASAESLLLDLIPNIGSSVSSDSASVRSSHSSSTRPSSPGVVGTSEVEHTLETATEVNERCEGRPMVEATASSNTDTSSSHELLLLPERLSQEQRDKIEKLAQLLAEWNEKLNLVSRKDIGNVLHRHLMPCVDMALTLDFEEGTTGEGSMDKYLSVLESPRR